MPGWVSRLFNPQAHSPEYQDLKFSLHRKLLDRINLEILSSLNVERVRGEIRSAVATLVEEEKTPLSIVERDRIIEEILDEVFGLGPLEPLLADPTISDILVTTPHLVYIERAGKLIKTPVQFKDNNHLLRIIEKVVSRVGRRVDESSPLVDARLPDGSRVNAAIPPVAVDGPLLSIRRFGKNPLMPADLVKNLTLTDGMLQLLEASVKARLNLVISGGTGAGKTTLLNALSTCIPEDERIVTIEDAAELRLNQEHVARMETRPPNVEGTGAIKIRQLVINALRMRPDRIVVGEVRGEEALDMLQAMNTGHDGSLTTIHANSPRDAVGRLEVMVGMANANMGVRSIRQQISSAVDGIRPDHPFQRRNPPGQRHQRMCGHGRRTRHDAGYLCFRQERRERAGPCTGPIPRHRYPAEILRAAPLRPAFRFQPRFSRPSWRLGESYVPA